MSISLFKRLSSHFEKKSNLITNQIETTQINNFLEADTACFDNAHFEIEKRNS